MMAYHRYFLLFLLVAQAAFMTGQHTDANIFGNVQCEGEHIPFAGALEQTIDAYVTSPSFFELNRDSNYVYGPATSRTYFIGFRLKSL